MGSLGAAPIPERLPAELEGSGCEATRLRATRATRLALERVDTIHRAPV